jgi:hypothetical protein
MDWEPLKGENMSTQKLMTLVVMVAFIIACNIPGLNTPTPIVETPTQLVAPLEVTPPAEAGIQHVVIPASLPAERSSHAGDFDSSTTAGQKAAAGGDRFTFGRFERPFNANSMDVYFSQLDIVDTYVFQDDTWIYGSITMKGLDSLASTTAKYALELDLNTDGKGDWLIVAAKPSSSEWQVEGVQIFEDANHDVGSEAAMYTDKNASGDGFENKVFDQGNGSDPDGAWARISPQDPNVVEISVKRSVLGNSERYLINMWAGTSLLDPALFDINDHFSHEQAGAADRGLEIFYPIKSVYEIDNSCRMAVGFEPTGQEPGLCEVFIPAGPGQPTGCRLNDTICGNMGPGYYFDAQNCQCNYLG